MPMSHGTCSFLTAGLARDIAFPVQNQIRRRRGLHKTTVVSPSTAPPPLSSFSTIISSLPTTNSQPESRKKKKKDRMPPRPRPPPGTPHGDTIDSLPAPRRPPRETPLAELRAMSQPETPHPEGHRGPTMSRLSTVSMNPVRHGPYDGESWRVGAGHGTPPVAAQQGRFGVLHPGHGGGGESSSSGSRVAAIGHGQRQRTGPSQHGGFGVLHPSDGGESSSSGSNRPAGNGSQHAAPSQHGEFGMLLGGAPSSSRPGNSSSSAAPGPPGEFGLLVPGYHTPGTIGDRPGRPQHSELGMLAAAPAPAPALPGATNSNPNNTTRTHRHNPFAPVAGVITTNGDWNGPNNSRSRIRLNGVHIFLLPRRLTVTANTRVLAPVPRWRSVLDDLDAQDQEVITHQPWRTMRERFPRGAEVQEADGSRRWRVEDALVFVSSDGRDVEMFLGVTRDPDHRITALDWRSFNGQDQAVLAAIWTLTPRAVLHLAAPSYHSFGDASDATDIDPLDPEPGRHPACPCCTRREARLVFACGHRMCRSCVLGTWWAAITRPHHWPTFLRCAFCRAEVGGVGGVSLVVWVLGESRKARIKLWAEEVEAVQLEEMRPFLRGMKRRFEKKEGKAPAPRE